MTTKKFDDIMKELEEQNKAIEETNDLLSLLLDGVTTTGDDTEEFIEYVKSLKDYTIDNINEAAPWLLVGSVVLPKWLEPFTTAAALAGSALAAPIDYANDHANLGSQIPEYVQDIYDYEAAYNEKVQAAKENINTADKMANRLKEYWDEIKKNLVDKNGKALKSTSEDDLQDAIKLINDKVPDANIVLEGNQIKNYDEVDKLIYNKIDKASINEKRSYLKESYDEVLLKKDIITEKYQNALDKRNHAYGDYEKALKRYDMAIANKKENATFGPSDTRYNLLLEVIVARKKFEKANLEYDAISRLYESYETVDEINKNLSNQESELDKAIAQAEYESNYPDAGKSLPQLAGEAYAKRESEKRKEALREYKSKANSEHESKYLNAERESKYLDAEKPLPQLAGEAYAERERKRHNTESTAKTIQPYQTDTIIPDEKLYSNEQPAAKNIPDTVYIPETQETVNSLSDAVISQSAALPEVMREIGQQSLIAFTEGFMDDDLIGEHIAEATQKIANIFSDNMGDSFYQSGSESAIRFVEGFEDEMNRIYESVMAEHSLAVEGMTAGQQMASFNYYQNTPQINSRRNEKIVLENKADVTVKIDREVLGKTMLSWTKEYERSTGT